MEDINYTRSAIRREMEKHWGPPPDDPSRNIVECKVRPKDVEVPDCHCGLRSVAMVSRVNCSFGQRYWTCPKVYDSPKEESSSQVFRVVFLVTSLL